MRLLVLLAAIVLSVAMLVPTLDDASTGSLGILVLPLLVGTLYAILWLAVWLAAWGWAQRQR